MQYITIQFCKVLKYVGHQGNTSNGRNRHLPGTGAQNFILKPKKITFGILNGIDMMGNDFDMNQTFASPTFRVAEMQIGGK